MDLKKVYQCGHCGSLFNKKDILCCGDFELEKCYQCKNCDGLFDKEFKHFCEKKKTSIGGSK